MKKANRSDHLFHSEKTLCLSQIVRLLCFVQLEGLSAHLAFAESLPHLYKIKFGLFIFVSL